MFDKEESEREETEETEEIYKLLYLFSSPLTRESHEKNENNNNNNQNETKEIIKVKVKELNYINNKKEKELLINCLMNCNIQLHFKTKVATRFNIFEEISSGPVMIHFSGHGYQDFLGLEDESGRLDGISSAELRQIFVPGCGRTTIVFISGYDYELTSEKFVEAGVEHVIATNYVIHDKLSLNFMKTFYLSLFKQKRTVQQAFDCASMLAQGGHFTLLPKDGNHDVKIFPNCPMGTFINDDMNNLVYNQCEVVPENFIGRNRELQQIYSYFVERGCRWVTICGEVGIGKSALASKACEYMTERRVFDAIYFVPISDINATEDELAKSFGDCIRQHYGQCANERKASQIESVSELVDVLRSQGSRKLLFVIDKCDAIPHDNSPDVNHMNGLEHDHHGIMPPEYMNSPTSHHFSFAGVKQAANNINDMGLNYLLDSIFRHTESNVKFLVSASDYLLKTESAKYMDMKAHEKVIDMKSLSDIQVAHLVVNGSPRNLGPSEMNSTTLPNALEKLKERPVLKALEGNPRAISLFCRNLTDKTLDDSLRMLSLAASCLDCARTGRPLLPSGAQERATAKGHSIAPEKSEKSSNGLGISRAGIWAEAKELDDNPDYIATPKSEVKWFPLITTLEKSLTRCCLSR